MKRIHLVWAAVFALAFVFPAQAQKDKKGDRKPTETLDADNVLRAGQVSGKLASVGANSVTLKMEYQTFEPKQRNVDTSKMSRQMQNIHKQQSDLAHAQAALARAKTPHAAMNAIHRIQKESNDLQQAVAAAVKTGNANPFKVVNHSANVEITLATDVKIRTSFLANVYDEMGNPKKFTTEELKNLKGDDPKLPGYKADITALKAGQKVSMTLSKNKETDNHVQATFVLITEESNEPVTPAKPPRKKN